MYLLRLAARPQRDAQWEWMTAHSITEETLDTTILGMPLLHIFWSSVHQQNILLSLLTFCCVSETNALEHVLHHTPTAYTRESYCILYGIWLSATQMNIEKTEHGLWGVFLAFVKHLFTRFANSQNASTHKRSANPEIWEGIAPKDCNTTGLFHRNGLWTSKWYSLWTIHPFFLWPRPLGDQNQNKIDVSNLQKQRLLRLPFSSSFHFQLW